MTRKRATPEEIETRKEKAIEIYNKYKDDPNLTREDVLSLVGENLKLPRWRVSALCKSLGLYVSRPTILHVDSGNPGTRICPQCKEEKILEEFPKKGKDRKGQNRYSYCKPCHSTYQKEKRIKNLFNLSMDDFHKLGDSCPICSRKGKTKSNPVDHEHKTGLIRGRICSRCNRGLAWFQDSPELLRKCADYLENPPASRILGRDVFGRTGRVNKKKKRIRSLMDFQET